MRRKKQKLPPRGRVFASTSSYSGKRVWYVQVVHNDVVLWEDNSTCLPTLCDELATTLSAFRHLHWLGQEEFLSWKEVVDRAGDNL